MKRQEHNRIVQKVVKQKNKEIQSLKEVMQGDLEFWKGEAEFWSNTVIKCQIQLEHALAELKECSENKALISNIEKVITYQG